jgi:hypothetical protein
VTSVIAGADANHDATACREPVPDYVAGLDRIAEGFGQHGKPLQGTTVGLIKETLETRVEVRRDKRQGYGVECGFSCQLPGCMQRPRARVLQR